MGHQEDIVKTESKIIVIRDTQVILDRDVAELYGVETREINQALRNNPKKFPPGYVIELNNNEKEELIKNFDRFKKLKHSTVAPHAFTEQGLYMLATILKGDLAISTTIAIIDTFTQLRKLARSIDKVNEDAKEHGILPDKATEGKIQAAMNEVFADKLPLKMRKLAEIGDLRKLTREELELYDEDIKNMRDIYATRKFDEKKGMEKGMAKGMEKEKLSSARRLLSMGLSDEQVSTATELPLEEIQKMRE